MHLAILTRSVDIPNKTTFHSAVTERLTSGKICGQTLLQGANLCYQHRINSVASHPPDTIQSKDKIKGRRFSKPLEAPFFNKWIRTGLKAFTLFMRWLVKYKWSFRKCLCFWNSAHALLGLTSYRLWQICYERLVH